MKVLVVCCSVSIKYKVLPWYSDPLGTEDFVRRMQGWDEVKELLPPLQWTIVGNITVSQSVSQWSHLVKLYRIKRLSLQSERAIQGNRGFWNDQQSSTSSTFPHNNREYHFLPFFYKLIMHSLFTAALTFKHSIQHCIE